jgi:hypothetical protein
MATTKIACPRCRAVLKSHQAPPLGKTIRCPGCGFAFPVTADMVQAAPAASPLAAQPLPATPAVPRMASPALPVAVAADAPRPGALSGARLGYVLGGVFLWLALGAGLGYYCFSANRGAAADKGSTKAGAEPAAKKKEKPAEPPLVTPPPEQQAKINDAVNRAVRYLRVSQLPNGTWPGNGGYPVGYAGLPGLTLLEAGVPASDPNVQRAAGFIREHARKTGFEALKKTYELALAILFLDRLKDAKDEPVIRTLAMRLVAGQTAAGGWTYDCPVLSADDESRLAQVLGSTTSTQDQPQTGDLPDNLRRLPVFGDFKEDLKRRRQDPADNSNTQFASLAVWVARGHDIPLDRTIDFLLHRFRAQEKDGKWDYQYQPQANVNIVPEPGVSPNESNPTMTAAGLLGLAVGIGAGKEGVRADQEPGVEHGFRVLGERIGHAPPAGRRVAVTNLYFLWSVERVAVLYQRKMISGKDWYAWGSGMLLPHQEENGSWYTNSFHGSTPVIDTCFATLFLRQANLAKDLTSKLQRLAGR